MSDRAYAKGQAQQKMLTGLSPRSRLLQRTCACGASPGIDGLCAECRDKRLTQSSVQRGFEAPSPSAAKQDNLSAQESMSSPGPVVERALRFSHDFSGVPIHSTTQVARGALSTEEYGVQLGVPVHRVPTSSLIMDIVQRAATDSSRSLDESVRWPLEQSLGHNFRQVRVHDGPASSWTAEHLSARAYTLGSNIYLGKETHQLSSPQYNRLLAHEAIHTVQQGGRPVAPQAKLEISRPTDAAEIEADHLAESIISSAERPVSRSLALRDQLKATPSTVSRVAAPLIQRDLTGDREVKDGTFTLNLKTESHPGAKNGMSGTIAFNASDKAPDSTSIRLLQVLKVEDLTAGKDYVWTGTNADRNKTMTTADKTKGIESGYHVDVDPALADPRTKKGDPAVSPYYRDYWPNATRSQDGNKKGKTVKEASLWDYPGAAGRGNLRFSFETAAKATDTNYVYGTVYWGFTILDASKGEVKDERAVGRNVTTLNFDEALKKFNEFYKNPGASTAPK